LKFTRLRLSGFKSFVEPSELPIEPGLTGIVGPNGCGKSNLLEALRWVMGENSAKSMRGDAMDDVIFSGAGNRPMRNMAEVALSIDNSERDAPSAYNDGEGVEIVRRIERDMGSAFRINGREARARDVQLFFADVSSGAHSTSMVRQGQIGQLIAAKPHARRAILEEAAGISGLHQRRHEAELKLNAAQANLARLSDVIQEIEGQLQGLKRQARQANRYRNISGQIRETEALALHLRWTAAKDAARQADDALEAAQMLTAQLTQAAAAASTEALEADEALHPLRERAAEKSAALHRLSAERMALEAEERRAQEAAARLTSQMAQIGADAAREEGSAQDAGQQLQRLQDEHDALLAQQSGEPERALVLQTAFEAAQAAVAEAEAQADRLTAHLADLKAQKAALERAASEASNREQKLRREHEQGLAELERLDRELLSLPDLEAALNQVAHAESVQAQCSDDSARSEAEHQTAKTHETGSRAPFDTAERELQKLKAESHALANLLNAGGGLWPPAIDLVSVEQGCEAALAAAFGDDLDVPVDIAAPVHWAALPEIALPGLPDSAVALAQFVRAPEQLSRRLQQTGIVERSLGAALQPTLLPGQRLVSREGDLWRWDGYVAAAEALTPAAVRLQQRNRLVILDASIGAAETQAQSLREKWRAARLAAETAAQAEAHARQASRQAERDLAAAREHLGKAERERSQSDARRIALAERVNAAALAQQESEQAALSARETLITSPDVEPLAAQLNEARNAVAQSRRQLSDAHAAHASQMREAEARVRRLTGIVAEQDNWSARKSKSLAQVETLKERSAAAETERTQVLRIPQMIAERRQTLMTLLSAAEVERGQANDELTAQETHAKALGAASRKIDGELAQAREDRGRAEALRGSARERLDEAATLAREIMDCEPDALLAKAEVRDPDNLPPQAQVEAKVERLKRERESLGGVNLRAEEEAQECELRLTNLVTERGDLEAAIGRLRAGIGTLNREGRERLIAAFDTVNANFQRLFTSLFQGGEARLTLTEGEDPLEAGLDILARPPGKRLQTMSLLSGGEQALTALALIFAVFLVNPAPICVLDEVDAPLDDANVERFCNLMNEMTRTTDTRFLVITHHALTMARMDRLIGVTMQERGVSQIVSVDLQTYAAVAEAAE
jgi:chromosome segregation protein